MVLDVELLVTKQHSHAAGQTPPPQSPPPPFAMAEVLVARESDLGSNDRTFTAITHLGRDIEAGDMVLGYDLTSSSMYLDDDAMKDTFYHNFTMPDIVLVQKAPPVLSVAGDTKLQAATSKASKKLARNHKEKRQRRRQNDGKRARELELRAQRMGFIEGGEDVDEVEVDDDDRAIVQNITDDDETNPSGATDDWNTFTEDNETFLLNDTDIAKEVLALEREFETLEMEPDHEKDDDDPKDDAMVDNGGATDVAPHSNAEM